MLLSVYLNPDASDCALVVAAVDLLNNHAAEFDAALVLQMVPDSWSVQLLSPFLAGAVRQSIHTKRMTQVALGLAQAENLIYKYEKVGFLLCFVFNRGALKLYYESEDLIIIRHFKS